MGDYRLSDTGNNLWKIISTINRRSVMFAVGATGFLHELLLGDLERPFLLALCGALMGLPFVLSADQKLTSPREEREGRGDS
jgi:hypothetical protein